MYIQRDYGGFDPSFIGATIRFSSNSAWNAWERFNAASEPPSLDHLTTEQRFEALSIVSVLSHEIRHFHDFLITPYSANIFRLRISALVNSLQMYRFLSLLKMQTASCCHFLVGVGYLKMSGKK